MQNKHKTPQTTFETRKPQILPPVEALTRFEQVAPLLTLDEERWLRNTRLATSFESFGNPIPHVLSRLTQILDELQRKIAPSRLVELSALLPLYCDYERRLDTSFWARVDADFQADCDDDLDEALDDLDDL